MSGSRSTSDVTWIYGWDVSTAVAAWVRLDPRTGLMDECGHTRLSDADGMFEKYRMLERELGAVVAGRRCVHFVEAPLSNFTRGATNKNTLLCLASINAVVSYQLDRLENTTEVIHIAPRAAMARLGLKVPKERAGQKKQIGLEFVLGREPQFEVMYKRSRNGPPAPKDWVFDRSDAYLIAAAGHHTLCAQMKRSKP